MQGLSSEEKSRITDLLLGCDNVRLCTIENALATARRELARYKQDLNAMDSADIVDGIALSVLNKLQRIGEDNFSPLQREVYNRYKVDEIQLRTHRIRTVLEEMIQHRETDVKRLESVRAVFIDLYPEATTSPRLSRLELSESPNRYALPPKYRSTSSLLKLPSPRKLLSRTKSADTK